VKLGDTQDVKAPGTPVKKQKYLIETPVKSILTSRNHE
jgi:hypothetical protein